jgi:hypothetical protein
MVYSLSVKVDDDKYINERSLIVLRSRCATCGYKGWKWHKNGLHIVHSKTEPQIVGLLVRFVAGLLNSFRSLECDNLSDVIFFPEMIM